MSSNRKTLVLKDLSIYAVGSNVANVVGPREIIQWKNQIVQMAKEQGFTRLELHGIRVTNSTSANPGKDIIIQVIDLTK